MDAGANIQSHCSEENGMKKWYERPIPQPWLTIVWIVAIGVIVVYGYAVTHIL